MTAFHKKEVDVLVHKASQALAGSQSILQGILSDAKNMDPSDLTTISNVQLLVLILQHRLDTQDALVKLLQIDNGFLQILGIGPHLSSKINLERMEFAIGNDELHHILFSLGQLVHTLWRIAQRYQQSLDKDSKRKQRKLSPPSKATRLTFEPRLQIAVGLQKQFISLLNELNSNLAEWIKLGAMVGPVLDEIAALRGPISQFYQAILNGLEVSHQLHEYTNKGIQLDSNLDLLVKQIESALTYLPSIQQPRPFFSAVKMDTTERLEERATNRRLGHFFRN